MKKSEIEKLGIIDALKPFSAVQLAKKLFVSKSYIYMVDRQAITPHPQFKKQLRKMMMDEAEQLIKFARSL